MVTFANLAEPGSLRKRWNSHLRLSAKRILFYFQLNLDEFRTLSGAVHKQNEPVYVMACVVKCEIPPIWRWKLCEFQNGKSISESGINHIVWRG